MLHRMSSVLALVLAVATTAGAECLERRELLVEGISRTLEGDPDAAMEVWRRLRGLDPTGPAAPSFEVYTLFSRQVADQYDVQYDAAIATRADEAIRLGRARLAADGLDAVTHFYTGQAYFQRARLRGIRGRLLGAGSDGEQARVHLERALELCPELVDAKLPLGMYLYYSGLLPKMVKWLSWLWFVPSGDAPTGRRYLEEVRAGGELYGWDATFLLMNIYTRHEPQLHRALALGGELRQRFPNSSLIQTEYLELLLEVGRYDDVVEQALLVEQQPSRRGDDASLRRMARLLRARAELLLGRAERAWTLLEVFGDDGPERPHWGSAWVLLTRGQILDARGERSRALAYYERVTKLRPPSGSVRAEEMARAGLEVPFAPKELATIGAPR